MSEQKRSQCLSFEGSRLIASGSLREVVERTKEVLDRGSEEAVLIFDADTSRPVEVDFRGSMAEVLGRLPDEEANAPRGPGRPKLGVVAREVTLLPRHWEWLASQPGGASVALRKLLDEARRTHAGRDRKRQAQESAYRFASAMAGNEPGYEEAMRALFAGQPEKFNALTSLWPADVAAHARRLAEACWGEDA